MRKFILLLAMTLAVMLSTTNGWGQDQTLTFNFENGITDWNSDGSSTNGCLENAIGGRNGSMCLRFNGYSFSSYYDYIYAAIPLGDIDAINVTSVSGYCKIYGDVHDKLEFGYNTGDNTTYTKIQDLSVSQSWNNFTITINNLPQNAKQLVFKYIGFWYSYLDDIVIQATASASSCPSPKELTCNSITATGASFTWQQGGSETSWQYIYGTKGFEPDWTNAQLATTQSVNLTGLSTGTAYDFYVRAYCSEDEQSEPVNVSFATPCDASQQCEITMTDVSGSGWASGAKITITDKVTKEVVKTFTGTNDDNVSICKGREYEISASGSPLALMMIGYKIKDAEGKVISTDADYRNSLYPLTFTVNCTNCFAPEINDETTSISANSATFSWTGVGNQWQYICVEEGGELNWDNALLTTEQTATLTGLYSSTEYHFYVRSYCSEDEQSDISSKEFTTSASETCLPVEDLNIPQYNYNSAIVVWTIGDEEAWKIQYKKHSEETWTNATIDNDHPIIQEWEYDDAIHAYEITGVVS